MSYTSSASNRVASYSKIQPHLIEEQFKEKYLPMTVLADEVFGIANHEKVSGDSFFSFSEKNYLTNNEQMQFELELENPNRILQHYRTMIYRYEQAYEKMAANALKWHYLVEDANNNEIIGKLLRDIQLLRKLTGSTVI